MLIATHEMAFAQEISDRVCFLDGGRVAEQGHPKQLFSSPSDERTRQFLRRVNF
jgi:polar amino acid transport system ATP-binding protein